MKEVVKKNVACAQQLIRKNAQNKVGAGGPYSK